jgi:hypothetical protein
VALSSTIQSLLSVFQDEASPAMVNRGRRQPAQAGMIVDVVVPVEEGPAKRFRILDGTETVR